jgi:peptidoglycan/xylan/chitin deacetylase (PgdA/CDA1 family)
MNLVKIFFITCLAITSMGASAQGNERRYVAITFDDLPVVCRCEDDADRLEITDKLLHTFKTFGMPVLGVVNEQKLESDGQVDPAKVALLTKWLEAGMELGNHAYAHRNINDISMQEYQKEILDGERITRPLAEKAGLPYRFYRHPYLSAGDNLAVRAELNEFLRQHNYIIAPNTITYQDYTFSGAYEVALQKDDTALAQQIRDAYLTYTLSRWETAEQQARDLFGRDIRHILMVHANRLNADVFQDVATMMSARGYTFISIDEALEDPVYSRPDTFDGKVGVTWLSRWAAEMGSQTKYTAASVPQFVHDVVSQR